MGDLVFISHASRNRSEAEAVLAELESHGLACWISSRDIPPGANYQESIATAIAAARAMVLVFTPAANDSPEVKKELALASANRIAVLPVRIENVAPTGAFQYELATRQWIDLFSGREAAIQRLADSIRGVDAAGEAHPSAQPLARQPPRHGVALAAGAMVAVAVAALLVWRLALPVLPHGPTAANHQGASPQPPAPGTEHVFVADQLVSNGQYQSAIKQYRLAIDADPHDFAARRKLIAALCKHLSAEAFSHQSAIDSGLRRDYESFEPVADDEIDAAQADILGLQAMDPSARTDPAVLLNEALILKTSGTRVKQAIPLLRQAQSAAPQDPRILAELGLLEAVLPQADAADSKSARDQGIGLIRAAISLKPRVAHYHFYLGRALNEAYECSYAGLDYQGGGDAAACAAAIREFHAAADHAAAEDVVIQHRAQVAAMDIFHRYARKEDDILSPHLDMTAAERLRHLTYLIAANASVSQTGPGDDPQFWQASLLNATGKPAAADAALRKLMAADAASFAGALPDFWKDAAYARVRPQWFRLIAKVLQAEPADAQTLREVQGTMAQAGIPPG